MTIKAKIGSVLLALLSYCYMPFAHWISTTPIGTTFFLHVLIIYGYVVLAAFGLMIYSIVNLFRGENRQRLGIWPLIATLVVAGSIPSIRVGMLVRMAGMERFSDRSLPLIAAIKKYELANLAPPPSLQALVPTYLPAVPSTGMMAYPEYRYITGNDAVKKYSGNSWALSVNTGAGFSFDRILYFPKQNYPPHGFGGVLEPVGVWAYVHE